jgi:CheY-like chemotaxis protein
MGKLGYWLVANMLVVDDELDIRNIVEQVLQDAGYGVATAANGAEALNRLREQRPDGIILDLNMPVMDGKAFLSACRADPAYAECNARLDAALQAMERSRQLGSLG